MIDLVKYYKDNYNSNVNDYYKEACPLSQIFGVELNVIDFNYMVDKWKEALYPGSKDEQIVINFYLISFYFYNNGYIVEEHPNILKNIKYPGFFSEGELKSATRKKYGCNGSMNGVAWSDRNAYIDELHIIKKYNNEITLLEDIDTLIEKVSTRNASFNEMTCDEKLENIRNVFENIGKKDGKYIKIPFEQLSSGYINSNDVKKYAEELQCFRHGETDLLDKRSKYTIIEKDFLIDYGKLILNISSRYLNKK